MEKTVLMVRHANGRTERKCRKCGQIAVWHDGGYSEHFIAGEYRQVEHLSGWDCTNQECGFHDEGEETDRYFERIFCGA